MDTHLQNTQPLAKHSCKCYLHLLRGLSNSFLNKMWYTFFSCNQASCPTHHNLHNTKLGYEVVLESSRPVTAVKEYDGEAKEVTLPQAYRISLPYDTALLISTSFTLVFFS